MVEQENFLLVAFSINFFCHPLTKNVPINLIDRYLVRTVLALAGKKVLPYKCCASVKPNTNIVAKNQSITKAQTGKIVYMK